MGPYFYFCRDCNIWVEHEPRWPHQMVLERLNGTGASAASGKGVWKELSPDEDRNIRYLIKDSRSETEVALLVAGYVRFAKPPYKVAINGEQRTCIHELHHLFRHVCSAAQSHRRDKRDAMVMIIKDEINSALRHITK